MPGLIITNQGALREKIGLCTPENMGVVTDFDQTLTQGSKKSENSWSVLQRVLGSDYSRIVGRLLEIFYRLEADENHDPEIKSKKLQALWQAHFNLLQREGLTRAHINRELISPIIIRNGMSDTIYCLDQSKIPVLIFSGGLEPIIKDVIARDLPGHGRIDVLANRLKFCEAGRFIGAEGPIIHIDNKTARDVGGLTKSVSTKTYFLVFGDSLKDPQMPSAHPEKVISVGFVPEDTSPDRIALFLKYYDIVVISDECDGGVGKMLCKMLGIEH